VDILDLAAPFLLWTTVMAVILALGSSLSGDQRRIWSNGVAEALYNAALALLVAVPALLAARFAFKRARA
jgi:biopolymer transport protein ExbB/TolQ